jgi:hypothetical protein
MLEDRCDKWYTHIISNLIPVFLQAYAIEVCRPEHEALALSLVIYKFYIDFLLRIFLFQ